MTSKDYLKQIAESKGVCPLTNEVKDNAILFPIGFEYIFQDLDRLEKLEAIEEEIEIPLVALFSIYKKLCEQKFVFMKIGHQTKCFEYDYYLIDDFIDYFDCENCKNTEKECWKKYFLKEVLENE